MMRYDDPFGYQPDDYDPDYPELRDDPHQGKYWIILGLIVALFWCGLAKGVGWI